MPSEAHPATRLRETRDAAERAIASLERDIQGRQRLLAVLRILADGLDRVAPALDRMSEADAAAIVEILSRPMRGGDVSPSGWADVNTSHIPELAALLEEINAAISAKLSEDGRVQ